MGQCVEEPVRKESEVLFFRELKDSLLLELLLCIGFSMKVGKYYVIIEGRL